MFCLVLKVLLKYTFAVFEKHWHIARHGIFMTVGRKVFRVRGNGVTGESTLFDGFLLISFHSFSFCGLAPVIQNLGKAG